MAASARMRCEKLRIGHTWARPKLWHLEAEEVVIWTLWRNQLIDTDGWVGGWWKRWHGG